VARIERALFGNLVVCLALSVGAPARPAAAQVDDDADDAPPAAPPSAEEVAKVANQQAAKDAYTQAAREADGGNFEAALALFRKADELVSAPMPKYRVAVMLDKLGRLAEAQAAYEDFLDSKPDPDKYFAKIEATRDRMRAFRAMPGRLRLKTLPEAPPNLVFAVDRVPQAGNDIVVMPGPHTVTAVADGFTGSLTLTVGPAEEKDVTIELVADRPAPELAPAAVAATSPPPPPAPVYFTAIASPPQPHARYAAYVMFGLAGVQAVVGSVFAVSAVQSNRDYKNDPTPTNLSTYDRQVVWADAFYATGLVSAVTGVVLLLLDDAGTPAASAPQPVAAKPVTPAAAVGAPAPASGP
jgi:hypothetical protein